MKNCLVTKLKGVVDNENLPKLGVLRIKVRKDESLVEDINFYLQIDCDTEVLIKSVGGVFYEWNKDSAITELTTKSKNTGLKLENKDYFIEIYDKYKLNGIDKTTNSSVIEINVEDLKYIDDIKTINVSYSKSYGDISWIRENKTIEKLNTRNSDVKLDLSYLKGCDNLNTIIDDNCTGDISNLTSPKLNVISLGGTYTGSIESFIETQVKNGRTTQESPIQIGYNILNNLTFGNKNYTFTRNSFLSWENTSKIILYAGTDTGEYTEKPTIYAKGATQQEISEWRDNGKTVVEVQ